MSSIFVWKLILKIKIDAQLYFWHSYIFDSKNTNLVIVEESSNWSNDFVSRKRI